MNSPGSKNGSLTRLGRTSQVMDLTPCAVVLARSRTSSAPFSVGLIETKDVQVSIIVPDLDVAVVRSVPLIKRFENVDLMLVEMKFQGHGLSTMISMLFDMNTHFWFRGHSKRHAINWRSTRAEFYQVGAYPQLWAGKTPSKMRTTAASSDFVQGG